MLVTRGRHDRKEIEESAFLSRPCLANKIVFPASPIFFGFHDSFCNFIYQEKLNS